MTATPPVILVVDDEEDLREALAFDFRRRGFRVLGAGSGREALAVLEAEPVDVVLSDVKMAKGDGVELLDQVKERNPFKPAFMLMTGYADITAEEAYARGADAIFVKPFEREQLFEALRLAVDPGAPRVRQAGSPSEGITVRVRFPMSQREVTAGSASLGRGGFFLPVEGAVPGSESCEFVVASTAGEIRGKGIVRWARSADPAGVGVEFLSFDDASGPAGFLTLRTNDAKSFIPGK